MDQTALEIFGKQFGISPATARRQLAEVVEISHGTDGWMKAPNGEPTKLNEQLWILTRTPAFKEWFGASKVVDENGDPLVMYHGTRHEFTTFKRNPKRPGIFFHSDQECAAQYSNGKGERRIIPVFLSATNPWDYQNKAHLAPAVKAIPGEKDFAAWMKGDLRIGDWEMIEKKTVQQVIASGSHDSFFVNDHPGKALAVYSPNQIKSAAILPYFQSQTLSAKTRVSSLKKVYETEAFWKTLLDSKAQAGPFDGGCLIAAKAILSAAGEGDLVRISSNLNDAEHYGARIAGIIYDFDGASPTPAAWITRFAKLESITDRTLMFDVGYVKSDIPDDPEAVKKIADMLLSGEQTTRLSQKIEISEDEGETLNAKVAFFDDDGEAHVRYALGADGHMHVLGIFAAGDVRGVQMLSWLRDHYGKNLVAEEVAPGAEGFWNKMEARGIVLGWREDVFGENGVVIVEPAANATLHGPVGQALPSKLGFRPETLLRDFKSSPAADFIEAMTRVRSHSCDRVGGEPQNKKDKAAPSLGMCA